MAMARPTMSPDTTSTSLSFFGPEMVGVMFPDVICDGPFCMMDPPCQFKDSSCSIGDRLTGFGHGFYLEPPPFQPSGLCADYWMLEQPECRSDRRLDFMRRRRKFRGSERKGEAQTMRGNRFPHALRGYPRKQSEEQPA